AGCDGLIDADGADRLPGVAVEPPPCFTDNVTWLVTRAESGGNPSQGHNSDVERVSIEVRRVGVDLDLDRPDILERIPIHPPSVVPEGLATLEIDKPPGRDGLTCRNGPTTTRAREQASGLRARVRRGCEHGSPTERRK